MGWVTDFEKQKIPEYWRAKQEYQDNYKANMPLDPRTYTVGSGVIIYSNVDSVDWNDYSGYEKRILYHRGEKEYFQVKIVLTFQENILTTITLIYAISFGLNILS